MIDAHHHIWQIGEHGHVWPTPADGVIYRTVTTVEFETLARAVGVTGSVLVQSQPCDEDTDFLTDLAGSSNFIQAVVGWVDLKAASASLRIKELAGRSKFCGLRPMLQSLPDDWLDDDRLDAPVLAMIAEGLRFDALIVWRQLPALIRFCDRHPELSVVLDHAAKPNMITSEGPDAGWLRNIQELAGRPQVYCKLSGFLTEAPAGARAADLRPWVEPILIAFGPRRVMWGSDWPVLEMASGYADWLHIAQSLVPAEDQRDVFEQTALRFYGLSPQRLARNFGSDVDQPEVFDD